MEPLSPEIFRIIHDDDWSKNIIHASLPGLDPSNRCFDEVVDFIPFYEFGEDYIKIHDPIWGDHRIGDQPGDAIYFRLLDNYLVRRSMAVEQLTLDPMMATIPNTASFSRWEHIWGGMLLVRKLIAENDLPLSDREQEVLQLRAFVSDLGHTAFSHLGDWLFQGVGNAEDQHDQELNELLEKSGIADILTEFGYSLEEIAFPETQDFVERKAPDLCVDRVDYAMREMNRWQRRALPVYELKQPGTFKIDKDGNLVLGSEQAAILYFKGASLLPTEHWGEPVHRLQEHILIELVKRSLTYDFHENSMMVNWLDGMQQYHPRDLMYTIDWDILQTMQTTDPFMWALRPIAQEIGREQRTIFIQQRIGQLSLYLSKVIDVPFPEPGKHWLGSDMPLHTSRVLILPVETQADVPDFGKHPYAVDFLLPGFKARPVDPLYLDEDGNTVRLSERHPDFVRYKELQQAVTDQAYVARLLVSPEYKKIIEQGIAENEASWEEQLQRPRMDRQRFQRLLEDAANFARNGFIDMRWLR